MVSTPSGEAPGSRRSTRRMSRRGLARAISVRCQRAIWSRVLAAAVASRLWRSEPPKRLARMSGAIASSPAASPNSAAKAASAAIQWRAALDADDQGGHVGPQAGGRGRSPSTRWRPAAPGGRRRCHVAPRSRWPAPRGDRSPGGRCWAEGRDRSVQPTAPPMAAPTGQRVMSPTIAAPDHVQQHAAWRLAGSIRFINDISPCHRGAGRPEAGDDEGDAHPDAGAEQSTMTGVIGRRSRIGAS